MRAFVDQLGVGAFDHAMDFDAEIWAHMGITGQPAFAFVNDDGTVTPIHGALGVAGLDQQISDTLG